MQYCAACGTGLAPVDDLLGRHYCCPACHGYAIQLANLHKLFFDRVAAEILEVAQQQEIAMGPPCPTCAQRMVTVSLPETERHVDVCVPCDLVWADEQAGKLLLGLEFETAPPPATIEMPFSAPLGEEAEADSALQAEEAPIHASGMARFLMQLENGLEKSLASGQPPEKIGQIFLAILGYPAESNSKVKQSVMPIVTAWLILLSSALSLITLFAAPTIVIPFLGLVPLTPMRLGGLTFLTSLFLHGSLLHLLCNMYMLLVFGKSTERYLGSAPFIVLLLLGAAAGNLGQLVGNMHSQLPCVGAGGAITAVMVFYLCAFPQAGITVYLFAVKDFLRHSPDNPVFRWVGIPVVMMGGLWFLLQALLFFSQLAGHTGVSVFSYLAGAVVGLSCWLMWRVKLEEHGEQRDSSVPYRMQTYTGSERP